ncbi:MAG: RNA-protein complex protein Nop10 [Thermoplasmatales archaeon]|nr:RNA-protein complex protein Nop10 [Thermoplasmatales archaeon]
MKYCKKCRRYTLKKYCTVCNSETQRKEPPRFSPQDKYGKYRRMLKEEKIWQKNLKK